jgi:hypothetical protein
LATPFALQSGAADAAGAATVAAATAPMAANAPPIMVTDARRMLILLNFMIDFPLEPFDEIGLVLT